MVPKDFPGELAAEFRRLSQTGKDPARLSRLASQIRQWPRNPANDPYQAGLEAIAGALQALMPERIVVTAFHEFCAPDLAEAVEKAVGLKAREIAVITTMYTRGGVHSEDEIPEIVERLRRRHPRVKLRYVWPFDLKGIARFLSDEIIRAERA